MFRFNALLAASLIFQSAMAQAAIVQVTPPPPPSEVMSIPDDLRNEFRTSVLNVTYAPEQRLRRIVDFMLNEDGLNLQYSADTTNTVAESYRTRQVNCLSFTLMAVALAREAGFKAQGQQINRVMTSNLVGDVVMQSMHANAVVTLRDRNLMVKDQRDFVLDIASNELSSQDFLIHKYKVDDQHLVASFYDNRAMELMAQGHLSEAQDWMGMALKLSSQDAMFWNNAGVLSQRRGDMSAAESWFLRSVRQNPNLMSVLNNLVILYRDMGKPAQQAYWQRRAHTVLLKDPYYQFALAQQQELSRNVSGSVSLYRRAIRLKADEPLFHFGLARAYLQLGQSRLAGSELALARDSGDVDRSRYQAKVDALKRMRQ